MRKSCRLQKIVAKQLLVILPQIGFSTTENKPSKASTKALSFDFTLPAFLTTRPRYYQERRLSSLGLDPVETDEELDSLRAVGDKEANKLFSFEDESSL